MPPPSTACVRTGSATLLALTGVKTIAKLRPYWEQTPCWFRILNRKESLSLAESDGFPKERIIFFHEGEDEKKLLDQLLPDAVLTKESGESGYFKEKVEAAQACGIPVYVIQRPPCLTVSPLCKAWKDFVKPSNASLPVSSRSEAVSRPAHVLRGCRQSRLSCPPEPNGTNR